MGLTPWEKYLEKKKGKKKRKMQQKKLTNGDANDIPENVDLNDPFFAEEYKYQQKELKVKALKTLKRKAPVENSGNTAGLDLLVMESDEEKNHFDFKQIVDAEVESKS